MEAEQQAGKNFAWLTVAQMGIRIFGALFFLFLTYKLRDTGIGQYSFVASFVPFWFIFVDFGGGDYLYREWARGQAKESIEHDFFVLFTARLFLISIFFLPFLMFNIAFNRGILTAMVIFYFAMFLAMFTHLAELYLQSINQFRHVATRQILEKIIAILAGAGLLLIWPKLEMIFVAILISQLVGIGYYYYYKIFPFKIKLVFDWQRSKQLFVRGLPFLFIGLFTGLYARIDITMLRFFKNFEAVGWYGTAYKFMDFAVIFPSLFLTAIFPLLSSLSSDAGKLTEFKALFQRAMRMLFSAALVTGLGLIFFSPQIVQIFLDSSFSPSILAVRILIIGQVVSFLSMMFNSVLLIQRKEGIGLRIIIFCALLNIALNLWLIPKYSLYGAAWATVICEVLNLCLLQRYVAWEKHWGSLAKMFALFVANGAILLLLKVSGNLNNWPIGLMIVLTNIVVLFTVKLLRIEDIKLFMHPFINKFKTFNL